MRVKLKQHFWWDVIFAWIFGIVIWRWVCRWFECLYLPRFSIVLILLMVITSLDGPAHAIGAVNWRRLHKTGLYVIGIAFLQTIVPRESGEFGEAERMVLVALTAAAILIRFAAHLKTRKNA